MNDTIESLRARLAEVERERDEARATMLKSNANCLRAQHDATDGDERWAREQARIAKERDAALAANAEMRAAGLVAHDHACKMAEFHGPRCEEHERHDEAPDDCLRCAADTAFGLAFAELRKALSRPDLGVGKVLVAGPLDALVDNLVRVVCDCHDGSDLWAHTRRDPEAFRRAVRGALLKKGGG